MQSGEMCVGRHAPVDVRLSKADDLFDRFQLYLIFFAYNLVSRCANGTASATETRREEGGGLGMVSTSGYERYKLLRT